MTTLVPILFVAAGVVGGICIALARDTVARLLAVAVVVIAVADLLPVFAAME